VTILKVRVLSTQYVRTTLINDNLGRGAGDRTCAVIIQPSNQSGTFGFGSGDSTKKFLGAGRESPVIDGHGETIAQLTTYMPGGDANFVTSTAMVMGTCR
jgi:hypothetical protein